MNESGDLGYVSISELARQRGVNKAAISRRVARLEEQGLIQARVERGKKLVSAEEFDRVAAITVDAVREMNGRNFVPVETRDARRNFAPSGGALNIQPVAGASGGASADDPVLAKEQARRASYDADLKKLDLEERLGLLISVDRVRDAASTAGARLARILDQLPMRADEMAAAVARDGVQGAHALLKAIGRQARAELAAAMARIGEADDAAPAAETETAEA